LSNAKREKFEFLPVSEHLRRLFWVFWGIKKATIYFIQLYSTAVWPGFALALAPPALPFLASAASASLCASVLAGVDRLRENGSGAPKSGSNGPEPARLSNLFF
jgi:hypothetical protein